MELNTFSIAVYDPQERAFGVAVTTARPNVGSICPFVSLKGAIGTQARVNPDHGRNGLSLLELGIGVEDTLSLLLNRDEDRQIRQLHGVDANDSFAFTGSECVEWAGHQTGKHFSAAGNMLVGPDVVGAMAEVIGNTEGQGLDLSERLIRALEAGQAAGGDKRGKQSAALLIASPKPRWFHNLRVDEHVDPVAELRRIHALVVEQSDEILEQYGEASLDLFGKVKW